MPTDAEIQAALDTPVEKPAETAPDESREAFKVAVDDFVQSLRGSADKIRETAEVAPASTPVASPATPAIDMSPAALTKLAEEKGVGHALQMIGQHVLLPMQAGTYELAAKAQRRAIENDPEIGKFARSHRKEIDSKVKTSGTTDENLARNGYEDVVRSLYEADPDIRKEREDTAVEARIAKLKEEGKILEPTAEGDPPAAPVLPRTSHPLSERPGPAPKAAQTPTQKTREQQIAATAMTDEELGFMGKHFHMSPAEARKQRFERIEIEKKYGEHGLKNIEGYPVCSLEDVGLPSPVD